MNKPSISLQLLAILFSSISLSIIWNQPAFAEENLQPSTIPTATNTPAPVRPQLDVSAFPVLRINDWRTETNLPWSRPVVMVDEFEGNYLAVFDKNYQDNFWTGESSGIISNWSRKHIRIYSYYSKPCKGLFCQRVNVINQANRVSIKVRDKVFRLEGKSGNFNLTEDLAYALKTSPPERTRIKIMFEENGREVINDIGEGTVAAWKTVYYDVIPPQ
jgi:hypothetical protein